MNILRNLKYRVVKGELNDCKLDKVLDIKFTSNKSQMVSKIIVFEKYLHLEDIF